MRKRGRVLEDLMTIGSRLHWRVALIVAVFSFGVLHYLATRQGAMPTGLSEIGTTAAHQLIKTCAGILQFLVPGALLVGAGAGFLRRRRGVQLLGEASGDARAVMMRLSWQDFERLLGAHFERRGFSVHRTGGNGPDGGVDLRLTRGHEEVLVQCKQWRARSVGVATVRELYGVMAARGAPTGIVVSVGDFTRDASAFAQGRNIELISGQALIEALQPTGFTAPAAVPSSSRSCPKCGTLMVLRTARRGPSSGQSFWGCGAFPRCRTTSVI